MIHEQNFLSLSLAAAGLMSADVSAALVLIMSAHLCSTLNYVA